MSDPNHPALAALLAFRTAENVYDDARENLAKAEQVFIEAIGYHHEMDDLAIPDGFGHFWIIGSRFKGIKIQHTVSMQLKPTSSPDSSPNA